MESATVISWSDLPAELVARIGSCPRITQIDVLRLRAVCTRWRSAIPPFKNTPPLPLKLKVPVISGYTTTYGHMNPDHFYLIESTVYLFQPLDDHGASNNPSSSTRSGWLVKFMQTVDGKLRLVNPLCHTEILVNPEDVPSNVLNLLDFRVSQVCKSYCLQYFHPLRPFFFQEDYHLGHHVRKILLISTNHYFSLMAIHKMGDLCYFKSGDEKWTNLKDRSCAIVDIIVYKENFHAVDVYGDTIKFDSSLNETKVASSRLLYNTSGTMKKQLVESSGQLFLVDMIMDDGFGPHLDNVFVIKMYQLDEEKHEWIQVLTIGDAIFFAGDDCCFSLSSKDFGDQCRGNCIYYFDGNVYMGILYGDRWGSGWYNKRLSPVFFGYADIRSNNDSISGGVSEETVRRYKELHGLHMPELRNGRLGSLLSFLEYGDIFWPPPSWLYRQDHKIKQQIAES